MLYPLVSIVIPCYNHEKFIQESIKSVIDQTYKNIELIIIDDGSSDSTTLKIREMINDCTKRFVRFEFRSRKNKGLSATLNEALEWCQGEYYSAIASDDIMLPKKTLIQARFLNFNKNINGVFGNAKLIDNNGTEIITIKPSKRKLSFKNIILSNYTIMAPSQMLRMNAIRSLGEEPYPTDIKIEDWYMWLKLSETGYLVNIQKNLVKYRMHENNTMKNVDLINKSRIEVISYFNYSKYYDRGLQLVYLINHIEKYQKIPIFLLKTHPKMILDIYFYKKSLQFLISKLKL